MNSFRFRLYTVDAPVSVDQQIARAALEAARAGNEAGILRDGRLNAFRSVFDAEQYLLSLDLPVFVAAADLTFTKGGDAM